MDGLKARLSFDAAAYDYDDEYLMIDTDTHTININNVSRLFGVQYDGNSKLIKFRIRNKLSDIQKMQDSIVYINWIDSRGVKGQSIAINKTINNDTCKFAWKVPFDALKNSGVLHFAMSAIVTKNSSSVIDQRWSTQIASVITPDGIYIKSYTPSSEEEDRIAQIYTELSNMINKQNDNLQSQVNSLKEDIIDLSDVLSEKIPKLISPINIEHITFKHNYSGATSTMGVQIQKLDGYDSYYFISDKDFDLWFGDNIPANKYVAVLHGEQYVRTDVHTSYDELICSNPIRLRNIDHTLPTEINKLSVKRGDVVAFTFTSGYIQPFYGYEFTSKSNFKNKFSGTYTLNDNVLDIYMDISHFIFKKIEDTSINLNAWRLYKGDIIKPNGEYFEMWKNSDAEGVVQIKDEEDFIGGYHGDEITTNIRLFVDGNEINVDSNIQNKRFNEISIYVESDVYHCNTSSSAGTIAFKRNKYLKFNDNKITIGNEWTAQSELVVNSAPLSLFQCYYKVNDETIAKSYMCDTDYKIYDLSAPSIHTPNSKEMSLCRLETKYASIEFIIERTSGQKPMGVVAYKFIESQNRIKFYYYTIYGDYTVKNGEKLMSQFEILIH